MHLLTSLAWYRDHLTFGLVNPIPTGHGQNQPIYERHVTKSGRNRVKEHLFIQIELCLTKHNLIFNQVSRLSE